MHRLTLKTDGGYYVSAAFGRYWDENGDSGADFLPKAEALRLADSTATDEALLYQSEIPDPPGHSERRRRQRTRRERSP